MSGGQLRRADTDLGLGSLMGRQMEERHVSGLTRAGGKLYTPIIGGVVVGVPGGAAAAAPFAHLIGHLPIVGGMAGGTVEGVGALVGIPVAGIAINRFIRRPLRERRYPALKQERQQMQAAKRQFRKELRTRKREIKRALGQ